ncbi:hypothetical protein PAPYR_2477 [Paratrimastix pyriformis]|uniref:NET domain-containing protein n=1 Tax=Paratrimastix pyriformis TaxID=342808 RepID=A0ABQ8UPD6_9EUKA|nr:hypothetical protein PAPYR_2477 [Paratrimastix pyriformis]
MDRSPIQPPEGDDQGAPKGLSFAEKRELTNQISMLPTEKLSRVLEIIRSHVNVADDDEIEIDLDVFPPAALQELLEFCRQSLPPRRTK